MSSDEAFLEQILAALGAAGLEAIVVGTTAAILQDAPLMTRDVDLLVRDTPLNRGKLISFAKTLGASIVETSPLTGVITLVGATAPVDIRVKRALESVE